MNAIEIFNVIIVVVIKIVIKILLEIVFKEETKRMPMCFEIIKRGVCIALSEAEIAVGYRKCPTQILKSPVTLRQNLENIRRSPLGEWENFYFTKHFISTVSEDLTMRLTISSFSAEYTQLRLPFEQ